MANQIHGGGTAGVASSLTFVDAFSTTSLGSLSWNGASGDWSTASNWSVLSGENLTPGALDDATINASGSYLVTATGTQPVNNLSLDAPGATLAIVAGNSGPGLLTVGGALTGGAGTLDLTHGGLAFANSESLDNLAISFVAPLTAFGVVLSPSAAARC